MRRKNILSIILLVVLISFFGTMIGIQFKIIGPYFHFKYKNYEKIVNDIDPDMPGYEIPISKNIELVNKRVSNILAYTKYNYIPDEYVKQKEEYENNKEKAENSRLGCEETLMLPGPYYGVDYKLSYVITNVEKIEPEEADKDKGVTDMYYVRFDIYLFGQDKEEFINTYKRNLAKIDESWIFYDQSWSALTCINDWDGAVNGDIGEE